MDLTKIRGKFRCPYVRVPRGCISTAVLSYGYTIVLRKSGLLTQSQLTSFRWLLGRKLKLWAISRVIVATPVALSAKTGEIRMGKGKGAPKLKVFPAKRGCIVAEIFPRRGYENVVLKLLRPILCKLPLLCIIR